MKPWERYKPDVVVYPGRQRVVRKHFKSEDGGTFDFETVGFEGKSAVTVVALTSLKEIIIAKQFRVGPEAIMEECPGGAIEPGEEPSDAGARELREETGYEPGSLRHLGTVFDSPYSNLKRHIILAEDCSKVGEPELDDTERVEIELLPIPEVISNAKSGKMTNGIAILVALDRLQEIMEVQNETTN